MTLDVQGVLIVATLAMKKMTKSSSVLIEALGRTTQVSMRQVPDNYKKTALFPLSLLDRTIWKTLKD